MSIVGPTPSRIASLDQYRGYTVAGMFLVNFVGSFAASPMLLKHHNNFCSYADTIMPQFLFAVGFALRLSFERRVQRDGAARAYRHVLQRCLGLALVAMVIYTVPSVAHSWSELVELGPRGALRVAVREWFQTLMHIAVTSLWILPVLRASAAVRVVFTIASAALHLAVSHWFYYDWVQTGGIDGGVLGFLAWTIPTITGTLACDAIVAGQPRPRVGPLLIAAALLMLGGWLLACGTTLYDIPASRVDSAGARAWAADPVIPTAERWTRHSLRWAEPPFVPPPGPEARQENYWMMSQRAATLSYHVFAAGLALAVYGLFYVACDLWGRRVGLFQTLGVNALVGYILHGIVGAAVGAFMPEDSPGWYVAAGFLVYFGVTYLFLRLLERKNIFITL